MKNQIFAQIVNTKIYRSENNFLPLKRLMKLPNRDVSNYKKMEEVPFQTLDNQEFVHFPQTWHNSNKLLGLPGFGGVKTGITTTAGSCLCVYFTNKQLNKNIITVVLGSKNIQYRWKDTRRITLFADACLVEDNKRQNSPAKKKVISTGPKRFE